MSYPYWTIPAVLTPLIWTVAILWPKTQPTGGMFNFGPALEALLHLTLALIATLVVWLVFFAVL